jgi:hypothetical protein
MTVLAHARAARYEVGTNLKGSGVSTTWTMLLPSLDLRAAVVIGRPSQDELGSIERVTDDRIVIADADAVAGLDGREVDLILIASGGGALLRDGSVRQAVTSQLEARAMAYGEARGRAAAMDWWDGQSQSLSLWPAFGPARVFIPTEDTATVARLEALGFLPPRGSMSPARRVANRLAAIGPMHRRWGRRAVLGTRSTSSHGGPPAYVVDSAREAGVDIAGVPWALVAPGDYPSQKVLLLLFEGADRQPSMIVKLGPDPSHAARLRNEADALVTLGGLELSEHATPKLRFRGEHAGRPFVAQEWMQGRPFTSVAEPDVDSPHLAAAVSWLKALATATAERRAAAEVGVAVRDLFERFRAIHQLPIEELEHLEQQVQAIERHSGTLPVVIHHGDPGTWNLLVDDAGRVAFLDWESAERSGLPLLDLVHLQFSFGSWAARRSGTPRRLAAAMRHFATPTALQARFTEEIADLSRAVDLPREMIEPMFFTAWMLRALKEATRRRPATLERGLYRRLLRELLARRDEPPLRRLLAGDP